MSNKAATIDGIDFALKYLAGWRQVGDKWEQAWEQQRRCLSLSSLLRTVNQYAVTLVPAEVCTTWLFVPEKSGRIIIPQNTAFPSGFVKETADEKKDITQPGLTTGLAREFKENPSAGPEWIPSMVAALGPHV